MLRNEEMSTQSMLVDASRKVLVENYGRLPMAVSRGDGVRLYDADGKEFLDFFAGFGGCGVAGHCHPKIVKAVQIQAQTLMSHGNLLTSEPQVRLAEKITRHAFGGKVFFCHSGAEANEAALKLVRLAAGEGRYKIISFHNCFHGRTMGGLSLTPESFQKGFEPMVPGNAKATYGDIESVKALVDDETAGIFIEPIQGEGGMNIPTVEFMQQLRDLCDENNILLVCDEVWTAPARTGKWFAYQHYGIEPDVMTIAKAIGGGVPLAACVVAPKYQDVLGPGTHGCTMGGNPLCAAAGVATMELIEQENLVQRAEEKGNEIVEKLIAENLPGVKEVRGKGMMIGISFDETVVALDVMKACHEKALLTCVGKNNVLRIAPPLTTSDEDLAEGLSRLANAVQQVAGK